MKGLNSNLHETNLYGTLYIVATPIGNLADMVPRAVETLQQVDLIAAEDTRHSRRLMEHFHISTPLVAYHNFNEQGSVDGLLAKLQQGSNIALISDAGTPLIADPGYRLVHAAQQQGVTVVPIPGACAVIAALSASGLASDRFAFEGFLPAKASQRRSTLEKLATESRTLIFYEAPHRVLDALEDMTSVFGSQRQGVMARELTKTFETIKSASLAELVAFVKEDSNQQKGEIVLLVAGHINETVTEVDETSAKVLAVLLKELPLKKAAALTAEITGVNKKVLYQWGIKNKSKVESPKSTE